MSSSTKKRLAEKPPCSLRFLRQLSVPNLGSLPQTQRKWLTPVVLGFARSFHLISERFDSLESFIGAQSPSIELGDLLKRGMCPYLEYLSSFTHRFFKAQTIIAAVRRITSALLDRPILVIVILVVFVFIGSSSVFSSHLERFPLVWRDVLGVLCGHLPRTVISPLETIPPVPLYPAHPFEHSLTL